MQYFTVVMNYLRDHVASVEANHTILRDLPMEHEKLKLGSSSNFDNTSLISKVKEKKIWEGSDSYSNKKIPYNGRTSAVTPALV